MITVRHVLASAVLLATGVLGGCVYDPYTGTYVPCCGYYGSPYYGSPYYPRYGSPYYPPPYPSGPPPAPDGMAPPGYANPPAVQPGGYPPNTPQSEPLPPPRPGATAYPRAQPGALAQRFAAANVTRDGRLTLEQAQAGMPMVARNFGSIDLDHKGYVTLSEIREFVAQRRAERAEQGQRAVQ